ncbi:MAG TPA: hypothetical protein VIG24_12995 [Acidimicrobiia bacterium]
MNFFGITEAAKRDAQRKAWEEEDRQKQVRRAKSIKAICNRHMDAAVLCKRPYRVKEHFVVSYEDMLRIWDIACHIEDNA